MTLQDMTPMDAVNVAACLTNLARSSFVHPKAYRDTCMQFIKQNEGIISVDDLRIKACQRTDTAYWFAFYVDECFHHETYQTVLGVQPWEKSYYMNVMKIDVSKE